VRTLRWSSIVSTVVAGTLAVPAPVFASGGLTGSNPPDQAILATAPAVVELTFSAPPDLRDSHVTARDATDTTLNTAPLSRADARTLRQPVAVRSAGDVTVAYHVSLRDGTEVSGSIRFSVGTGRPPVLGAAAQAAVGSHEHGVDPLSAILLVVDAAVAFGVVLLLMLRPPRREPRPGGAALGIRRRREEPPSP